MENKLDLQHFQDFVNMLTSATSGNELRNIVVKDLNCISEEVKDEIRRLEIELIVNPDLDDEEDGFMVLNGKGEHGWFGNEELFALFLVIEVILNGDGQ